LSLVRSALSDDLAHGGPGGPGGAGAGGGQGSHGGAGGWGGSGGSGGAGGNATGVHGIGGNGHAGANGGNGNNGGQGGDGGSGNDGGMGGAGGNGAGGGIYQDQGTISLIASSIAGTAVGGQGGTGGAGGAGGGGGRGGAGGHGGRGGLGGAGGTGNKAAGARGNDGNGGNGGIGGPGGAGGDGGNGGGGGTGGLGQGGAVFGTNGLSFTVSATTFSGSAQGGAGGLGGGAGPAGLAGSAGVGGAAGSPATTRKHVAPAFRAHQGARGANGSAGVRGGAGQGGTAGAPGIGAGSASYAGTANFPTSFATQLLLTVAPAGVAAGTPFGFTVQAENAQGQVDPTFAGSVTVSLAANPGGSKLGGTLTVTASNGIAVFTGLTLNKAADGYQLKVKSSGVSAALTAKFSVAAGAAVRLVAMPATVLAAKNMGFSVTVAAEDAYGNVDTTFNDNVTAALASNAPAGLVLAGTSATVQAQNGLALFSELTLNQVGTFTLGLGATAGSSTNLAGTASVHVVATESSLPSQVLGASGVKISSVLPVHETNPKSGIGVVALAGDGIWQFSVDGSAWLRLWTIPSGHALLLPQTYRLRFRPARQSHGQASLQYFVWNGAHGTAGKIAFLPAHVQEALFTAS
jgi:hypothetical protein